ncbi:MAG: P-type conjugative transfer protein TrbL [Alphaproteobacteria bacterium]|nr:P-type conjugative transfer protein TrbL [Alphaproteobacteria bacterium]
MKINTFLKLAVLVTLCLSATSALAAIDNAGLFDTVLQRYADKASNWATVIAGHATWMYWVLVSISMVWTFGFMALRRADLGEFFAEFIRFTIVTGFFWWLLINGPAYADGMIQSMRTMAGNATGLGGSLSPSGVVDIGFDIFNTVLDKSSLWSPVDSAIGIIIALIILVILALIGVNMLLLLISGWILAYAGIFYLGFGGSRWTSDIAINYYKTVLGIAMQLFTMVLLVGIGSSVLNEYYANMSAGVKFGEMAVVLIVAVILLVLVNKVPPLIAGVITGSSVGGMGIGQFGAGAALGAAATAGAAAAMGGAMVAAGTAQAAGGAQAVMAAIGKAQENVAAGTDIMSSLSSGGASSTESGSGSSSGSAFAQAAGFAGGKSSSIAKATSVAAGSSDVNDTSVSGGSASESVSQAASAPAGATSSASQATSVSDAVADSGGSQDSPVADAGSAPAENSQASENAPAPTSKGGIGAALAKAGRIAADASANLARGTSDVAKEKANAVKEAVSERISDTFGGQVATAIHAHDSGFGGNSLSGSSTENQDGLADEIASFTDKDSTKS